MRKAKYQLEKEVEKANQKVMLFTLRKQNFEVLSIILSIGGYK